MDKLKKLITIISLLVIIVAIYLYSSTKVEHLSFSGIIETTKVVVLPFKQVSVDHTKKVKEIEA